jgi:hypothetical protein
MSVLVTDIENKTKVGLRTYELKTQKVGQIYTPIFRCFLWCDDALEESPRPVEGMHPGNNRRISSKSHAITSLPAQHIVTQHMRNRKQNPDILHPTGAKSAREPILRDAQGPLCLLESGLFEWRTQEPTVYSEECGSKTSGPCSNNTPKLKL